MTIDLKSKATNLAPIVLFVYNRPWHTKQTVEALKKNELSNESELFFYSDAPKNEQAVEKVAEVRKYIKSINGFKKITVVERDSNWGLASSIIDGVTNIINAYGKIIVLEDDLVTSPYFLKFMNEALSIFEDRDDICSITGFSFSSKRMKFSKNYDEDIYLNIRPMSWSWATWKNSWDGIDWYIKDYDVFISDANKIKRFNQGGADLTGMLMRQMEGKLDSWYIRWCYHAILNNKLTVYPVVSFVNNLGFDNTGVHCGVDKYNNFDHRELNRNPIVVLNKNIKMNNKIVACFNEKFNLNTVSKIKYIIKKYSCL